MYCRAFANSASNSKDFLKCARPLRQCVWIVLEKHVHLLRASKKESNTIFFLFWFTDLIKN